jgi:hypothetical protein
MGDENPLQSYNPFQEGESRPAPPSFSSPPSFSATPDDEQDLRTLEQELNIWESRLAAQEQQLARAQETGVFEPPPNWPSAYPLVYFDSSTVPEPLRPFAERAMLAWTLMAIAFALNFIGCLSLLRAGEAADSPGSKIALSALYLFLIVPIALDLSALAVYRALQNSAPSSLSFVKIFIFLGAATVFQAILTLGFETSGSCGLITMLNLMFGSHPVIGTLALFITAALAVSTYVHFALLNGLWNYWRGTDQGRGDLAVPARQIVANVVLNALASREEASGIPQLSPR